MNMEPDRIGVDGYIQTINDLKREVAELRALTPSAVLTTLSDRSGVHLSSDLIDRLTEAAHGVMRGHFKAHRLYAYDSSTSAAKYAGDRRTEAVFLVLDQDVYKTIVEPVMDQAERDGLLDIETTIS
jgi:hypothetical protein